MRIILLTLLAFAALSSKAFSQDCIDYGAHNHWVGGVDMPEVNSGGVAVSGDFAYVADGELRVFDITDPSAPLLMSVVDTLGGDRVVIAGSYAYTNGNGDFQVFDLADPVHPQFVGSVVTPGTARDVTVSSDYAYVADWGSGLQVIDLTDPAAPQLIAGVDTPGFARRVAVSGNRACVADEVYGLQVIDITDPENPLVAGGWNVGTGDITTDVDIYGNFAYVGVTADVYEAGATGFYVVDITDPANPTQVGGGPGMYGANLVVVSGNRLYVGFQYDGGVIAYFPPSLKIMDLSNPAEPQTLGEIAISGSDVAAVGEYAYITDYHFLTQPGSLNVYDVADPASPEKIGRYTATITYDPAYSSMAGSGNYVYLAGDGGAFAVFDVTDPAPVMVPCLLPVPAFGVAAAGNYIYIGGGGDLWHDTNFHVFDMTDPTNPQRIGGTVVPDWAGRVVLSGGYAFVLAPGDGDGLRVIDITDPAAPLLLGCEDTPGLALGLAIAGGYACIAADSLGLQVIDISDPTNPGIVGSVDTPGRAVDVAVRGDYAFVADEGGGLQVIEITDPAAPLIVDGLVALTEARSVDISGNYAYVAHSGLPWDGGFQVIEVADPASPRLVGNMSVGGSPLSAGIAGDMVCVYSLTDDGWEFKWFLTLAPLQCDEAAGDVPDGNPGWLLLHQAYPNPFNPQTTIAFEIPERQAVSLQVFDLAGRLVKELITAEPHTPGRHEVVWNGRDDSGRQVASGTYFYRLEAGSYSETKRMVLVK